MQTDHAINILEQLRDEAADVAASNDHWSLSAWTAKTLCLFEELFGTSSDLYKSFKAVRYSPMIYTKSTPSTTIDQSRIDGVNEALGLIEAAIFKLGLTNEGQPRAVNPDFDPDLFKFVERLIRDEDWGKVASQVAIFVEDYVRKFAGDPLGSRDETLVGKGLMARVFSAESALKVGNSPSEIEGWRFLAMGFTQALSNVDRHRIQNRPDSRQYAMGVLGLGSLILTQLKNEHSSYIECGVDDESRP